MAGSIYYCADTHLCQMVLISLAVVAAVSVIVPSLPTSTAPPQRKRWQFWKKQVPQTKMGVALRHALVFLRVFLSSLLTRQPIRVAQPIRAT